MFKKSTPTAVTADMNFGFLCGNSYLRTKAERVKLGVSFSEGICSLVRRTACGADILLRGIPICCYARHVDLASQSQSTLARSPITFITYPRCSAVERSDYYWCLRRDETRYREVYG